MLFMLGPVEYSMTIQQSFYTAIEVRKPTYGDTQMTESLPLGGARSEPHNAYLVLTSKACVTARVSRFPIPYLGQVPKFSPW